MPLSMKALSAQICRILQAYNLAFLKLLLTPDTRAISAGIGGEQ
jgi:hypothetical protein